MKKIRMTKALSKQLRMYYIIARYFEEQADKSIKKTSWTKDKLMKRDKGITMEGWGNRIFAGQIFDIANQEMCKLKELEMLINNYSLPKIPRSKGKSANA
jgi:hypothetical protein